MRRSESFRDGLLINSLLMDQPGCHSFLLLRASKNPDRRGSDSVASRSRIFPARRSGIAERDGFGRSSWRYGDPRLCLMSVLDALSAVLLYASVPRRSNRRMTKRL